MTQHKAQDKQAAGDDGTAVPPVGAGGNGSADMALSSDGQVIRVGKSRKKKKYSSRGAKRAAKSAEAHTKGAHRVVNAAERGIANWRKNWDRSSRKRRDGGVRDGARNRAKAISAFVRRASKAAADVAKGSPRPVTLRKGFIPPLEHAPLVLGPALPLVIGALTRPPVGPLVAGAVATALATALVGGRARGARGARTFAPRPNPVVALGHAVRFLVPGPNPIALALSPFTPPNPIARLAGGAGPFSGSSPLRFLAGAGQHRFM